MLVSIVTVIHSNNDKKFRRNIRFSMKVLIHSLVLICILGSNMAWAWDSHPEILTGHVAEKSSASTFLDAEEANDSDIDLMSSDTSLPHDHYCCCGHVHVVAIAVISPAFVNCKAVKSEQAYSSALLNYIPSLPIKPPRI